MKKIMVVDDEATITTHLEELLTSMGYEVAARASSGEEAVAKAEHLKPDLILMDIVMPGKIDGIEASQRIRAQKDIPIIFLTAHADDRFIERARSIQPYGYILKPFQTGEIKASIETALFKTAMERRLLKSEEKFRSVVESARDAIILSDINGTIIEWNQSAQTIFGYEKEEVLGRPLSILMPARYRNAHQRGLARAKSEGTFPHSGKTVELHGLKKNGEEFPIEISFSVWKINKESFYSGVVRDITERKQLEDQLRDSQESFEAIVNKTPGGIIIVNQEGRVRFVNPAAETLFRKRSEELVGSMFGFPIVAGESTEIGVALKNGRKGTAEMRLVETQWKGEPAHFISLFDVTAVKEAEKTLLKANQELKKLDEMKTDFIAVASHELRTPLTSTKNAIDTLLSRKAGELHQSQERFLTMAARNINRLAMMINDLLDLTKLEAGKTEIHLSELDLMSVIQEAIVTFKSQADLKSQTLEMDFPEDLPTVYADRNRIDQVLYNLISNALKFTPEGGSVCLSGRLENRTPDSDLEHPRWVEISVTDTGIGLSPDEQKLVFDPFVQAEGSLGRTHKGTGLGLYIVKKLLAAQGGMISVESQAGKGSRFFFTLPVFSRQATDINALTTQVRRYMESPPFSLLRIGFKKEESLKPHLLKELERFSRNVIRRSEDRFVRQPAFNRLIIILPATTKPNAVIVRQRLENAFAQDWPFAHGRIPDILGPFTFPEDGQTERDFLAAAKIIMQHRQQKICEAIDL